MLEERDITLSTKEERELQHAVAETMLDPRLNHHEKADKITNKLSEKILHRKEETDLREDIGTQVEKELQNREKEPMSCLQGCIIKSTHLSLA